MAAARINRNWIKWPAGIAGGLVLIIGVLIWAAGTETALQRIADLAAARSGGELSVTDPTGSLYGPLRIKSLRYETATIRVVAEDVELDWSPWRLLSQGRVELTPLKAAVISVKRKVPSPEPLAMPNTLRLPVQLSVPAGTIARIVVENGGSQYTVSGLKFRFAAENDRHRLNISSVSTPWGNAVADVSVAQDKPFSVTATGQLSGTGTPVIGGRLQAHGTLERIAVSVDGTAGAAKFSGSSLVQPFEKIPVRSAEVQASGINPAQWHSTWPVANIEVNARAGLGHAGELSGEVKVRNTIPGSIDQQRLPLVDLSAMLAGTLEQIRLSDLVLNAQGGSQLKGNAQIGAALASADLTAVNLNLRGLHSKLVQTRLKGTLQLGWDGKNGTLLTDLVQNGYQFHADAKQTGDHLVLRQGVAQAKHGELMLKGDMSLSDTGEFQLEGVLRHFDPSLFGEFPVAQINATLSASGRLFGQRSIVGAFDIADSRWANEPLGGSGKVELKGERLARADVTLKLAENRLTMSGSLGAVGDRLALKLDAPNLNRLGAGFAGKASAEGTVEGTYTDPSGSLQAAFSGFKWMEHQFASGRLNAQLSRGIDGPMDITASVSGFRSGGLTLSKAMLELHGTRGHHQAALAAQGGPFDLQSTLSGGWSAETGWEGRLETLENKGRYPLELLAPAPLVAGPGGVSLRGVRISLARGTAVLDEATYHNGDLTTRGSFSGISASDLQHMSGSSMAMELSLILAGSWELHAGQQLDGTVAIRRESGDAVVLSEPRAPLGLSALSLQLAARRNRVSLHAEAQGTHLGSLVAQGETAVSRRNGVWGIEGSAPIDGSMDVSVQSLAWLAPLVSPALVTDGSLRMQFTARGTVKTHQLGGSFAGNALRVELPDQGIYLKNGVLHGELVGDRLVIRELALDSGAGRLTGTGDMRLQEGVPQATLAITADKAELVSRPDRLLILSGKTSATVQGSHVRIEGKLRADRGVIELPKADLPTLSDDVVVLGREDAAKQKAARLRTEVDMEFDLGEQFFLKGRGLDAQLAGVVRLRSNGSGLPLANGSIHVVKGDYFAYGQRLVIDRGILNFAGPVDNPGLNIVAMRKNQAVEAGVSIAGTALAPQVKLVSNPPVSDTEKMSWLVLGHGLEGSSKSELGLMGAAATALLAAGESVTLQSQIAHAAGLDEFGLSGAGGLESTVVTLGKRLSSRAYVSYEQGVTGASNLIRINYTLSKRWSVRAQSGTDNAVDLLYTLSFD